MRVYRVNLSGDRHTRFRRREVQGCGHTCVHEGVQQAVPTTAHDYDEFLLRAGRPRADMYTRPGAAGVQKREHIGEHDGEQGATHRLFRYVYNLCAWSCADVCSMGVQQRVPGRDVRVYRGASESRRGWMDEPPGGLCTRAAAGNGGSRYGRSVNPPIMRCYTSGVAESPGV